MSVKDLKHNRIRTANTSHRKLPSVLFIFIFFHLSFYSKSQKLPGDEWINTGQTYLRIPVIQTGFYKITSQELTSAGLAVDQIPTASFQMFRRGKELAIEVESDTSGKLSSMGFYGQRNDGAPDSAMYVRPGAMPHKYYSLYADTAAYFLTWRTDGLPGKRIEASKAAQPTGMLNYHFEEATALFNSFYSTGSFYPVGSSFDDGTALTAYDTGEGWTGKELNNAWQTIDVTTSGLLPEYADQVEIELVLVGRKAGNHEVEIWSGTSENAVRKMNTVSLHNYQPVTFRFLLQKGDIGKAILPNGKIAISLFAKTGTISVSHVLWRYPQKSNLSSSNLQKVFHFTKTDHGKIWNAENTSGWKFYDRSDPYNLTKLSTRETGIAIAGSEIVAGVKEPLKVSSLKKVRFQSFDSLQTDYLIISHPLIRKSSGGSDPVAAYAAYRASPEGGNYKTLIVNSEEVFDQFNYGEPGPLGIRNIIRSLCKAGKLKFVFIMGHSTDPQTARKLTHARSVDMIPNAGWPGSDLALSMDPHGDLPDVPMVPMGRINAETPEQVWTYLQKVKAMEAQPASASWRKNVLHLSGGRSLAERTAFRDYARSFEKTISKSALGVRVQTISKQNDAETEQFPLHIPMNKGIALMTLYGHSGIDVSDIDLGYASDEKRKYRNGPFFPAVIVNGCALGSIFYSNKTISTDWIFSPGNGAVLFLAHTFNGVSSSLKHYSDAFYEVLADSSFMSEPFGIIQKEAIRRNMLAYPTLSDRITAQQMNLHGDPAIRIFPARLPDYTFDSLSLNITDLSGKQLTAWSDSVQIQVVILNNGRFRKENYQLSVKASDTTSQKFTRQSQHNSVADADTLFFKVLNPFTHSGETDWLLTLDPDSLLTEENKSNNTLSRRILIPEGGAFPLLPLAGYVSNQREIELVAQIPLERVAGEVIFEWDTTSAFTSSQRNTETVNGFISKHTLNIPKEAKNIFWRVYIPEDANRPSQSSSFIYKPDSHDTLNLPEVIAFLPGTLLSEIREGEPFMANVSFVNISNSGFQDSVLVSLKHLSYKKNENSLFKMPPLPANKTLNFPLIFPTTGETGLHQVTVRFNYNNLPEEIYSNNEIHFSYMVVPDRITPILNVNVDHRQLADGDYVSAWPEIEIQIIDENKYLIIDDTTGVEVWLKEDCLNCSEQRIYLSNATTSKIPPNEFQVLLKINEVLKSGTYQLRVKAKDVSGNQALDYTIRFKVPDKIAIINAGAAPNPSADWFRFYVDMADILPDSKILITIYDLKGRVIKKIRDSVHEGKNEWFWHPGDSASGLYFYQIKMDTGHADAYSGAANKLKGKLIWLR